MSELNGLSQDLVQANGRLQITSDDPSLVAGTTLFKRSSLRSGFSSKACEQNVFQYTIVNILILIFFIVIVDNVPTRGFEVDFYFGLMF